MNQERFNEIERERMEKERLDDYLETAKNNPILQRNKIKFVNSNTYGFFKFVSILFLIVLISFIFLVGKIAYDGKLQSTYNNVINPLFNASVKIDNKYEFNPNTENRYNNNFTIINNLNCSQC